MSVMLAVSVACMLAVIAFATKWLLDSGQHGVTLPCPGATASPSDVGAPRNSERCLLCDAPLLSLLVTREQVIARVEHRIDSDVAAVTRLLATPPSAAWVNLFRP